MAEKLSGTYKWKYSAFGREEGHVEQMNEADEPRLRTWLAAWLVVDASKPDPEEERKTAKATPAAPSVPRRRKPAADTAEVKTDE